MHAWHMTVIITASAGATCISAKPTTRLHVNAMADSFDILLPGGPQVPQTCLGSENADSHCPS